MKKALALLLALSMLLTLGLVAFAETPTGYLIDETTTKAPKASGLDPAVAEVLGDSAFPDDIMSTITDLFGGFSLDTLTGMFSGFAETLGVDGLDLASLGGGLDIGSLAEGIPGIGDLLGGGNGGTDVIASFIDTIAGFLPGGINLQDQLAGSTIFSFFSKLYTGVYTSNKVTDPVTEPETEPVTEPVTEDTPEPTPPPKTGVETTGAFAALGVLTVAVAAAVVLRKKKVQA
ncbi:MAG: LPXTG cell wall anchor domain-containing protein [Oscillospiraceae bacterium]|nr:LPXTG cell wall anchor domain-containing protein [Oscillospiraceae bacterium]